MTLKGLTDDVMFSFWNEMGNFSCWLLTPITKLPNNAANQVNHLATTLPGVFGLSRRTMRQLHHKIPAQEWQRNVAKSLRHQPDLLIPKNSIWSRRTNVAANWIRRQSLASLPQWVRSKSDPHPCDGRSGGEQETLVAGSTSSVFRVFTEQFCGVAGCTVLQGGTHNWWVSWAHQMDPAKWFNLLIPPVSPVSFTRTAFIQIWSRVTFTLLDWKTDSKSRGVLGKNGLPAVCCDLVDC